MHLWLLAISALCFLTHTHIIHVVCMCSCDWFSFFPGYPVSSLSIRYACVTTIFPPSHIILLKYFLGDSIDISFFRMKWQSLSYPIYENIEKRTEWIERTSLCVSADFDGTFKSINGIVVMMVLWQKFHKSHSFLKSKKEKKNDERIYVMLLLYLCNARCCSHNLHLMYLKFKFKIVYTMLCIFARRVHCTQYSAWMTYEFIELSQFHSDAFVGVHWLETLVEWKLWNRV